MILSCLLINSDAIEVTIRNIPIDAFYFQNHQEIYRAIIFMYRNKAPRYTYFNYVLQDNGLLQKSEG
jgi:replicative DNA helicase